MVVVVAIAIVGVAKVVTVVPSLIRKTWKKKRNSGCATVRVSGAEPQTTVRMRRPRRAQLRLSRAGDAVKVEELREVVVVAVVVVVVRGEDTRMEGISSYQLAGWLVSLSGAVSLSASLLLPLKVFLSFVRVVLVVVVSLVMMTFSSSLLGGLPAGAVVVVSSWSWSWSLSLSLVSPRPPRRWVDRRTMVGWRAQIARGSSPGPGAPRGRR